jgi:hypothetical protein
MQPRGVQGTNRGERPRMNTRLRRRAQPRAASAGPCTARHCRRPAAPQASDPPGPPSSPPAGGRVRAPAARGRAGRQARAPAPHAAHPMLTGWKPSTSLRASRNSMARSSSRWRGSGSCTSTPSTAGSAHTCACSGARCGRRGGGRRAASCLACCPGLPPRARARRCGRAPWPPPAPAAAA